VKEKISLFCDVPTQAVVESLNAETIYEVPLAYEDAGLGEFVADRLGLEKREPSMGEWRKLVKVLKNPKRECRIAVVGKYTSNGDAYKSIGEALVHAGPERRPREGRVDRERLAGERRDARGAPWRHGRPGGRTGFGGRGVEGKIQAIRYARETGLPFLGICLGLQMAVIEFARNVALA
jgi:CTP synthase